MHRQSPQKTSSQRWGQKFFLRLDQAPARGLVSGMARQDLPGALDLPAEAQARAMTPRR